MKYVKSAVIPGIAILLATATAGCSDSDDTGGVDRGDASADDSASDVTDDTATGDTNTDVDDTDTNTDVHDTGTNTDVDDTDTNTDVDDTDTGSDDTGDGGVENDGSTDDGTNGETYPAVPSALSLTGCSEIGPLCTVVQVDGDLTANCGGLEYTGKIATDGALSLMAEPEQAEDGAIITRACEGDLSDRGQLSADCTVTVSVEGEPDVDESCELESDPVLQPAVECMQLPSKLSDVELCVEGSEAGGETIAAGTCPVVQDGCSFQAQCANGTTLFGDVSTSGIRFAQTLPALADAEAPSDGGDPQFLAGALVSHSCSAELDGTSLLGECAAGRAGRGGTNTSVCAVGGAVEEVAECAPLSSVGHEQIFVLDSCDALKNGEGGEPGIGEPLCAFRQNNCVWEIECGGGMTYTGRIEPGDTTFEWQLATGTQCEGSFTEQGEFSGVCAVPDLFSCDLGSKAPEPGAEACPSAPIDQDVTSRGCGNGSGDRMACREIAWHGCDFMALCSFASMESLVFAGTAFEDDNVGRLDFNGLPNWTCSVGEPTEDALESDPYRASNEWIGQCQTAEGGLCRDNFDPATGEGFRGLQLFWGEVDEPEPLVDAGVESDSGADAGADAGE